MSINIDQLDEMLAFLDVRIDAGGMDYEVVVLVEDLSSALHDMRDAAVLDQFKQDSGAVPPFP